MFQKSIDYLYTMKFFFGFLFLLFYSCNSFAQQPAFFLFGEKEFEGVDIYNLIQDDEFNYWIATEQGIMKHDGYSFKSVECDKMKSTSIFNFVKDKLGTIYCHNLNHQIFKIYGGKCELFFEIPEEGKGADIYLLTTNLNELIIVSKEAYVFSSTGKKITSSENINHGYLGFPFLLKDGTITCSESNMKRMLVYKNTVFSEK